MICPFWRNLDNLGDRPLNAWLLPRLFPGLGAYHDSAAKRLLYGIGSLLGNERAMADLPGGQVALPRLVFSTGAYHAERLLRDSIILCVRGRFTCDMIGVDHRHAVADGAILLLDYLPIQPVVDHDQATVEKCEWTGAETQDHFSTRTGCDFAGFVRHLLSFRRIKTHSMHAAIIADAYGVPWFPLRWEAKWADHFEQLGIRGRPATFTLSPRSALAERRAQLWEHVQCARRLF